MPTHSDRPSPLSTQLTAHVGRQVVHLVRAGHHGRAVFKDAQVDQVELVAKVFLLRVRAWEGRGRRGGKKGRGLDEVSARFCCVALGAASTVRAAGP